jgi:uncharacterized protein YdiU (UPF0061 family)
MLNLSFDNRLRRELTADPDTSNRSRQVYGALWSDVQPTPVAKPELIAYSPEVAKLLGLSAADMHSPEFAEVFGGNRLIAGMQPWALNYGGHQFGNWAGQLGDGRAMSLGEIINSQGQRWELQLKGAGMTPYSRRADGRAVLRSSIREFLCSEAMFHLGIPTTRALSLVKTGDLVMRDMFYDGNPEREHGAIVCRVAPSFLRFGNFQLPAQRGETALLNQLLDFTIARDYPELNDTGTALRLAWFYEVCQRTAVMVAHWMRVGFVHGVMNTDNMSILGLSIDYGPYGWLENYDPMWTPNTTDEGGRRYAYGQQPYIAQWNLARLAESLFSVIPDKAGLEAGLQIYADTYAARFGQMLAAKFGIRELQDNDAEWINRCFDLMYASQVDMSLFFRNLANLDLINPDLTVLQDAFYDSALYDSQQMAWQAWLQTYVIRINTDNWDLAQRQNLMNSANPWFVLRNYLAQQAIDLANQGDYRRIMELLDVARNPYIEQPRYAAFVAKRPEWARHKAGCSMLSCSS